MKITDERPTDELSGDALTTALSLNFANKCACGRPIRLSGRSKVCAVCARGVVTPRPQCRRKMTGYEKGWLKRRRKAVA